MPLNTNTVELLDTSIALANQLAQTVTGQSTQPRTEWDATLKALAIAGFEQWLKEGATSLAITHPPINTTSTEPEVDLSADLVVGSYRLCILAMGSLSDDQVEIFLAEADTARADTVIDAIAHLYVMVEVQEEINQVCILAGLRREQLLQRIDIQRLQQAHISAEPLVVPISYFDVEPEQILLYLSCLEPVEVTAEEAIRVAEQVNPIGETLRRPGAIITDNLINTGAWLQGQLDAATELLQWTLLPPLSAAMRPVRESVDTVLQTLATQGIRLPEAARGVCGPISVGACICQLYAWVWPVETADELEWMLFLLLGPQIGETLPMGIQLQVSDRTDVLVREVLAQSSSEAYLYTQVQGSQQEQFKVSVTLPDGLEITLPVFGFETVA
ncbi:hypothetical protein S7335_1411 [Synechococcus sp. PCC 7335]|nr:hypothetical protein S7335_1411 [Synechococcus sp. PCC 7335]